MSVSARGLTLWLSLAAVLPGVLASQGGTIVGRTVVKGSDVVVGYSVVGAKPGGREQFTNAEGRFTIRDVPAGAVALSVRHIGYSPYDTTLVVAGADTVRVRVELSLVTIQLPAIHSLAKSCAHPGGSDAQVGAELAVLFEQVKENANRNRLLSRSYPSTRCSASTSPPRRSCTTPTWPARSSSIRRRISFGSRCSRSST